MDPDMQAVLFIMFGGLVLGVLLWAVVEIVAALLEHRATKKGKRLT